MTLRTQAAHTGEWGYRHTFSPALPTSWFTVVPARTHWLPCRKFVCVCANIGKHLTLLCKFHSMSQMLKVWHADAKPHFHLVD